MGVRSAIRGWIENPVVSTQVYKAFLVTVIAMALVVPLALVAVPYIDFFNDMAVQDKVKSQMTWKLVDNTPIPADFPSAEGSLPRGVWTYPFPLQHNPDPDANRKIEEALAQFAGEALTSANPDIAPPFERPTPTLPMIQRGQKLYETTCIACHGRYGMGDGSVPRMGFPTPPNLLDARERAYPDGRIFHIITSGQNNVMASYADRFRPADRWAIVFYIRALQAAFPPPEGEAQ
jgi:mono/diheme cytochrome c family protein